MSHEVGTLQQPTSVNLRASVWASNDDDDHETATARSGAPCMHYCHAFPYQLRANADAICNPLFFLNGAFLKFQRLSYLMDTLAVRDTCI